MDADGGGPVVVELPKSKKELKADRKRARAAATAAEVAKATRGVALDAVTNAAYVASDSEDDEKDVALSTRADAGGESAAAGSGAPAARTTAGAGGASGIVFQRPGDTVGASGNALARKKPRAVAPPVSEGKGSAKRKNVLSFDLDDTT